MEIVYKNALEIKEEIQGIFASVLKTKDLIQGQIVVSVTMASKG